MTKGWYKLASPQTPLSQGDLIADCPVLVWATERISVSDSSNETDLEGAVDCQKEDVIVMTQACDLEQGRVAEVVLCPHYSLASEYYETWKQRMREQIQKPTEKAWQTHMKQLKNGFIWNLALLGSGRPGGVEIDLRVVDFARIRSLPRAFLDTLLLGRQSGRLQLCPPYREHLSQAFARFFMRVGLPTDIKLPA